MYDKIFLLKKEKKNGKGENAQKFVPQRKKTTISLKGVQVFGSFRSNPDVRLFIHSKASKARSALAQSKFLDCSC